MRSWLHCPPVETNWPEDIASLTEAPRLSRSAQLRHLTQSAFTRRIWASEAWTGIDLADCSDPIYETEMAEGPKTVVPEGRDFDFLPDSRVRKEFEGRRVAGAVAPWQFDATMAIRICYERPELTRHPKPNVQELGEYLGRAHVG